ncbi:DNA topoisomerase (ATP-hydrolyzing) [Proteiniclasticum sp. QWL-01]|uniref:DNA topoisomerase (ATP-hydrolyzing) n=1 Tax=Proteiniclasticum sp. QWL-01 TaxID=3036945 RepID=UPI00240F0674|nr:DNA topoisomerase (ATP-hydrolyzing) [Proteiniclasticum sp. QWL-01]WFF71936.1 DNA topoisomerase 4 subunit A [Proteiniclasticum sp. QWL-01]
MSKSIIPKDQNIIDLPLEEAMPDNYLPYAVEVAKDRALPDVRDGLKPVHRRILYGAYLLKAYPDRAYMKSARIVGDIMGKFHPHGDSSVYDAMTILAQDFSTRIPLIEGQGNWGSMDGDSAAAMRYTEARLSKAAMALIGDIDSNTVDFVNNYSDTETEPVVMPAKFPNLLVNGSFGIAVGLSTNIPPHNLGEIIDATCALIENPELTVEGLMKYVPGPDLPTGGTVIGRDGLKAAYETGEGKAVLRAKTQIEKLDNGRLGIVITEFPYRKNKARILQTISEMTGDKKHQKALEAITDIRDESGRAGVRGVIELRKSAGEEEADRVLKYLLKKTDLQSNLNFNMVAIDKGKPVTFGMKGILSAYIEHQREVITRRTQNELEIAERRFHIVEGFMHAIDVMDELIITIRASNNKADANSNIQKQFGFTEMQATAILELMLYRLTGLEMSAFLKEHEQLAKLIKKLKGILAVRRKLDDLIVAELKETKEQFSNERRTLLIDDEGEAAIHVEELIVVEDSMVTLSQEGFIKQMPLKSYHRSSADPASIEYREGDQLIAHFVTNTLDQVYLFTNLGNLFQLESKRIPEAKWKDKGTRFDEFLRTKLDDEEKVVAAFSLPRISEAMIFKFFTDKGRIKRTLGETYNSKYTKLVALKLAPGERLYGVLIEEGQKLIDHRTQPLVPTASGQMQEEDSMILTQINPEEDWSGENGAVSVEYQRFPEFLSITTEQGLTFSVPEGECEVRDKMVLPDRFAVIPEKDRIVQIRYVFDYEIKPYELEVTDRGEIKPIQGKRKTAGFVLRGDSYSELIFLTADGMGHKLPGYLFENLKSPVHLSSLFDFEPRKRRIVGAFTGDSSQLIEEEIILATAKGLIKRTLLHEFLSAQDSFPVVKFRHPKDQLVFAQVLSNPSEVVILLTERGMAIKFSAEGVSQMGRTAGGVQGMSLKEEDQIVWGSLEMGYKTLELETNRGGKSEVKVTSIKNQNRAGKGSNIMKMVLDETISKVTPK